MSGNELLNHFSPFGRTLTNSVAHFIDIFCDRKCFFFLCMCGFCALWPDYPAMNSITFSLHGHRYVPRQNGISQMKRVKMYTKKKVNERTSSRITCLVNLFNILYVDKFVIVRPCQSFDMYSWYEKPAKIHQSISFSCRLPY